MPSNPRPDLGPSVSPVYDLQSDFGDLAALLDARRLGPTALVVVPCDEAVDYALGLGSVTFQQMINRVLRDARSPTIPHDTKAFSGWMRWCLEASEVQMSPRLVAAYVMAIQELIPHEAITLFRLWLAVPDGHFSAAEETTLQRRWQGKLPRIEKMLQRGELTRVQ
jgi:hypothetical protein